jgi:hypothetical protein
MDTAAALAFLEEHQPMPADEEMPPKLMAEYEEVRKFLKEHPVKEAIPLLLGSFGAGWGFGVYQLVDEALVQFPNEDVLPSLIKSLESPSVWTRFWAAHMAANFPSPRLIEPLSKLLGDDAEDVRWAAVNSLESINDPAARSLLEQHLLVEKSADLLEFLQWMLTESRKRRP